MIVIFLSAQQSIRLLFKIRDIEVKGVDLAQKCRLFKGGGGRGLWGRISLGLGQPLKIFL